MLMADQMLNCSKMLRIDTSAVQKELLDGSKKVVEDSVIFQADDAFDYCCSVGKSTMNAIPNILPPFPVTWIEYTDSSKFGKTGISIMTARSESAEERNRLLEHIHGDLNFDGCIVSDESIFTLICTVFHSWGRDMVYRGRVTLHCDQWGNPDPGGAIYEMHPSLPPKEQEKEESSLMGYLWPALMAISFMHCKNVRVEDNAPRKTLSKRHENQYGRPLLSYKTLEIEPMKKVLETEGNIKRNGIAKALHICRGHFATYTPEKGMLGRKLEAPVTVWKPAHVRGDAKHGIAAKDYKVKAPKS